MKPTSEVLIVRIIRPYQIKDWAPEQEYKVSIKRASGWSGGWHLSCVASFRDGCAVKQGLHKYQINDLNGLSAWPSLGRWNEKKVWFFPFLMFSRRGMLQRSVETRSSRWNCLAENSNGGCDPSPPLVKSPCLYYYGSCDISMGNVWRGLKKKSKNQELNKKL